MADGDDRSDADAVFADLVRRSDPERWLCALFAPPERRASILALLALNQELGRVAEVTREPMTALIRLQWWRDALDSDPPDQAIGHPVVRSLRRAVDLGHLEPGPLRDLVDAREQELQGDSPDSIAAMSETARAIAGRVQRLTATALGARDPALLDAAERLGTAWGVVGAIRATSHRAALGRIVLPLAGSGIVEADIVAGRMSPALADLIRTALAAARALVPDPPDRAGPAGAAFLLRLPTLDYLTMIEAAGCDPFLAAGLRRRPLLPARLVWTWLRSR